MVDPHTHQENFFYSENHNGKKSFQMVGNPVDRNFKTIVKSYFPFGREQAEEIVTPNVGEKRANNFEERDNVPTKHVSFDMSSMGGLRILVRTNFFQAFFLFCLVF